MKKLILAIFLMFASSAWAACVNTTAQTTSILAGVTSTGIGSTCYKFPPGTSKRFIQVIETGSGAITGTILLEGSADCVNFNTLDTFSETGTTAVFESVQNDNSAVCIRGNVTALTGTNATVSLLVGVGN